MEIEEGKVDYILLLRRGYEFHRHSGRPPLHSNSDVCSVGTRRFVEACIQRFVPRHHRASFLFVMVAPREHLNELAARMGGLYAHACTADWGSCWKPIPESYRVEIKVGVHEVVIEGIAESIADQRGFATNVGYPTIAQRAQKIASLWTYVTHHAGDMKSIKVIRTTNAMSRV